MRKPSKLSTVIAAAVCSLCAAGNAIPAPGSGKTPANAAIRAAEAWAFPVLWSSDPSAPHAKLPQAGASTVMRIPGSTRSYTWAELDSDFVGPDWFPQDHPPAPHIVLHGRKPAGACGACHYANGSGDIDSATLAGLPKAYLLEQIKAFGDGQRVPPDPYMVKEARNLDAADLQQAADYFSSLKLPHIRRVVETVTVPKTHWEYFVHAPDHDGAREPIGERIIEVSDDQKLYRLWDERVGFVAYVPPGSIARGARIAAHGTEGAQPCESCHGAKLEGADLPGTGIAPPLAGRSPTYLVKELILFHEGERTNPAAVPMRAEASALTVPEMIDVAAYAASRQP
jgi:cytochrome c553